MRHTTPRHRDLVAALAVVSLLGPGTAGAAGNVLLEAAASFHGEQAGEYVGEVSGLGDVNGDGLDDFSIGARGAWGDAGAVYLFFGRQPSWALDTPIGEADILFHAETAANGAGAGYVASPGDLDGDGLDDVVIDDLYDDEAAFNAGQAYVAFGKPAGWDPVVALSNSDASFQGPTEDCRAGFVNSLGDLNGDGFADLATTGCGCNNERGTMFLVFGGAAGWAMDQSLTQAAAAYWGESPGDFACRVGGGGDVDGDGMDDLVVGAPGNDTSADGAGAVYLVLGRAASWPASEMVRDPQVSSASFLGEAVGDSAGYSVALVQDVNGDDLDDILIGSPDNSEVSYDAG